MLCRLIAVCNRNRTAAAVEDTTAKITAHRSIRKSFDSKMERASLLQGTLLFFRTS
jgi:hypothetical protein